MKLTDRVAVITGAGRGIGRAISVAFAREGANLVLLSRTLPELQRTAAEIRALNRRALVLKTDVSSREEVERSIDSAVREFGTIDILVNNAAVQGPIGPLVHNDVNKWVETIHINLIGVFLCCRAVLPHMIKSRHGKIINFSGGGATSPRPYFSAYAVSKAAVVRLTETLAKEVEPFNIQVNAIAPGTVNTAMLHQILEAGTAAGNDELEHCKQQIESGGTPAELPAALAVYLASDESNGLTGRLISAVWDDWRNMTEKIPVIQSSELYTLRRITEKHLWK